MKDTRCDICTQLISNPGYLPVTYWKDWVLGLSIQFAVSTTAEPWSPDICENCYREAAKIFYEGLI